VDAEVDAAAVVAAVAVQVGIVVLLVVVAAAVAAAAGLTVVAVAVVVVVVVVADALVPSHTPIGERVHEGLAANSKAGTTVDTVAGAHAAALKVEAEIPTGRCLQALDTVVVTVAPVAAAAAAAAAAAVGAPVGAAVVGVAAAVAVVALVVVLLVAASRPLASRRSLHVLGWDSPRWNLRGWSWLPRFLARPGRAR